MQEELINASYNFELPENNENNILNISQSDKDSSFVDLDSEYLLNDGDVLAQYENTRFLTNEGLYEGQYKDGVYNGRGTFFHKNGSVYIGDFLNGSIVFGTMSKSNGLFSYSGQFKNWAFHGNGQLNDVEVDEIYYGQWEKGLKEGNGTLIKTNQKSYTGFFKNDKFNGNGYLVAHNGIWYNGNFKDGIIDDVGTLFLPGKGLYVGSFKNGKADGYGKLQYIDGCVYSGNYSKGFRSGIGKMVLKSGEFYEGGWEQGQKTGFGVSVGVNFNSYLGNWKGDLENGKGKYKNSTLVYQGDFIDGKFHGQGKCSYRETGEVYEGLWVSGNRCGKGILEYPNKERVKGTWFDDNYLHGDYNNDTDSMLRKVPCKKLKK